MATTSKSSAGTVEDATAVEQYKRETLDRRIRAARALAERIRVLPDGSREFVRFTTGQRIEHVILMLSFGTLAVTGLVQTFSSLPPIAAGIEFAGGIDAIRIIHRLAAIISAVQSIYHLWRILETWFVKRQRGGMWPAVQDVTNLVQMVLFNAGLREEMPRFDRYTIEEKLEYWALLWGQVVMGVTGFVMWFPLVVTSALPGDVFPVAQVLHRWEAILAALAIATWHMYHGCIKDKNQSIFTGVMPEEEMRHMHPLEYERIMAAAQYLHRLGIAAETTAPRSIFSEPIEHGAGTTVAEGD